MKRLWLIFAQTVTVLLAGYFVVLTLQPGWLGALTPQTPAAMVPVLQAPANPTGAPAPAQSLSAAVRKAAPAVVSINTSTLRRHPFARDPWFRFFFGDGEQISGLGSGVILSSAGHVVTNNHVVKGADAVEVVLADGRRAAARIVGTDAESDLAVLKIDIANLPVMTLGDSDQLQVGDTLLAIGNPFGVGQTVTSGIASALGRNQLGLSTFENFIQTDAAINPGNSGGALTDVNGDLVGINTAIFSRSGGNMGIGFAIPVNTVKKVLASIVASGHVVRGWIGVELSDLTPELAQAFGSSVNAGVMISGVLNRSPAARAGLRPGDIITVVDGVPVHTPRELLDRITALPPGQATSLVVYRGNARNEVAVKVAQRPPQAS